WNTSGGSALNLARRTGRFSIGTRRSNFVSVLTLSRSSTVKCSESARTSTLPGSGLRISLDLGPGRPGWLPTQVPHRSGRVEQETHLVTSPRPTSQVPIIGFSALLQLVEWYQVRLRRNQ